MAEQTIMTKEEFLKKLNKAKSPEELIALAKEDGFELSEEKAKKLYDMLRSGTELSDDELEGAAGGKGLYWIGVF